MLAGCMYVFIHMLLSLSLWALQVVSIYDLDPHEALHAANRMRRGAGRPLADPEEFKEAVSFVGGRLAYLNKVHFLPPQLSHNSSQLLPPKSQVAKAKDMTSMSKHLLEVERAWLLSQIGQSATSLTPRNYLTRVA